MRVRACVVLAAVLSLVDHRSDACGSRESLAAADTYHTVDKIRWAPCLRLHYILHRLRGGGRAPGKPMKDMARVGLEPLMDSMTNGWFSRQEALRDHCESITRYGDEEGTEVYNMRKGFDLSTLRRRGPRSKRRPDDGLEDEEDEVLEDSEEKFNQHPIESESEEVSAAENASIAVTKSDFATAEAGYESVLRNDPNNTGVLNNYAALLMSWKKDWKRAEAMLNKSLQLDPTCTSSMVHLALALVNSRDGRENEAEKLLRKAVKLDPENIGVLNNYAMFLKDIRKDYLGAEALLLRAEAADRYSIVTLGNLASLLYDHFPDRRFVEDRPDVVGAHYNLSGRELARRLVLRAFQTDASHGWVQQHAPEYLVGARSGRDPAAPRPSDYHYEPGVGLLRTRHGVTQLVNDGVPRPPPLVPPAPAAAAAAPSNGWVGPGGGGGDAGRRAVATGT